MRILALTILAVGTLAAAAPAPAQTYDPSYPVCLHVYGPVNYYECRYTSLPQCNMSGSIPISPAPRSTGRSFVTIGIITITPTKSAAPKSY
jgi:Protein of unknown function (DUF3551)